MPTVLFDKMWNFDNYFLLTLSFLQMGEYSWGDNSRAPGSHLNNMKSAQPTTVRNLWKYFLKIIFCFFFQPPHMMDSITTGHNSIPASPTYHKMRTSSGDSCRLRNKLLQIGKYQVFSIKYLSSIKYLFSNTFLFAEV